MPSIPGSSSTTAPKSSRRRTVPVKRIPGSYVVAMFSHGSLCSAFMDTDTLPVSAFILTISTVICCPADSISDGCLILRHEISDTCRRASTPPKSTNAPKSAMRFTSPETLSPTACCSKNTVRMAACSTAIGFLRETTILSGLRRASRMATLQVWPISLSALT